MSEPSNMRPVRVVRSCKYSCSCEKVVSSGSNSLFNCLSQKYVLITSALSTALKSFQALAAINDAYGENRANKTLLETREIRETCSGFALLPIMLFLIDFNSKNYKFCFGTKFGQVKKHKLFITVYTTLSWVKPVLPVEPILLTSTLLWGHCERRRLLVD